MDTSELLFELRRKSYEQSTVRVNRTPDIESGPFDHSGTSPLTVFSELIIEIEAGKIGALSKMEHAIR